MKFKTFIVCWTCVNLIIFIECYYCYAFKPEYYYLREMLGIGLLLSRGAASVLNINCFLILLPVCRFVNSYIHLTFSLLSRSILRYWLYNLQNIHITIAFTIVIASVIHSVGHVLNAMNASVYFNHRYPSINWAFYQHENPFVMIMRTISGSSGLLMLVLLFTMSIFSVSYSRKKDYVLFQTAHCLFLPFIALYFIHPLSKILKQQINYTEHIPGSNHNCTVDPIFVPIPVQNWKWMLPAISVYLFDLLYRVLNRNKEFFIVKQIQHLPANVYKLTLTGYKRRKIYPAQYILLQCPKISSIEWHPFTVVSCNEHNMQTEITVLIRARGDWTDTLARYSRTDFYQFSSQLYFIRFLVDGGFFSPLSDVLNRDVAFCIASGIGITPFASILNYLNKNWHNRKFPRRIHLLWVIPYSECLSWCDDLLADIYDKVNFQPDRLEYKFFVTREKDDAKLKMTVKNSFLRSRIYYGRPDWFSIFNTWHSLYYKSSYPLYLCGSKNLTNSIEETCHQFAKIGVTFNCINEVFV